METQSLIPHHQNDSDKEKPLNREKPRAGAGSYEREGRVKDRYATHATAAILKI